MRVQDPPTMNWGNASERRFLTKWANIMRAQDPNGLAESGTEEDPHNYILFKLFTLLNGTKHMANGADSFNVAVRGGH